MSYDKLKRNEFPLYYPGTIRFTFSRDRLIDIRPASSNLLSFDCRIVSCTRRIVTMMIHLIKKKEFEENK